MCWPYKMMKMLGASMLLQFFLFFSSRQALRVHNYCMRRIFAYIEAEYKFIIDTQQDNSQHTLRGGRDDDGERSKKREM